MIGVVIPCRNAARHLPELLRSLVGQDPAEPWEIVFVDNRSTDGSGAVAEGFRDRLPLRSIEATSRSNASYARNAGVRETSADKLLFLDADDAVAAGYVAAMGRALDSHGLVTSRVDSVRLNPEWLHPAQGPPWQEEEIGVFFDFLPATGINIGIRRTLFDSLGGFPEEYAGSQDIAFSWTAQLAGARLTLVRDAVYLYRYRDGLVGLFRQARNWGHSNTLLYKRFRERGMPGRSFRQAAVEWREVTRMLLRSRRSRDLAPAVVRFGFCLGRLTGSLRHRVVYP